MRNPKWTRDELILSLDFYMRYKPSFPGKASMEILELSDRLNRMGAGIQGDRDEKYRNANGTYMKLMNFRRFDTDYEGGGLKRGGKEEELVWNWFATKPVKLRQTANAIIQLLDAPENQRDSGETGRDEFGEDALEGQILTREHRYRERDAKIVKRKKENFIAQNGRVMCEACGFDFRKVYGERGDGFIECHHTKPVSELKPGERTKLSDLVLLCSNCHRMIHRRRPWLQLEDLRSLFAR